MAACLHCRTRKAAKARGLCKACYASPARGLYPCRWSPDWTAAGTAPPGPTAALPGTEAKVDVMVGRAERGEALFHPGDAQAG